jgi:hypothetical protein
MAPLPAGMARAVRKPPARSPEADAGLLASLDEMAVAPATSEDVIADNTNYICSTR